MFRLRGGEGEEGGEVRGGEREASASPQFPNLCQRRACLCPSIHLEQRVGDLMVAASGVGAAACVGEAVCVRPSRPLASPGSTTIRRESATRPSTVAARATGHTPGVNFDEEKIRQHCQNERESASRVCGHPHDAQTHPMERPPLDPLPPSLPSPPLPSPRHAYTKSPASRSTPNRKKTKNKILAVFQNKVAFLFPGTCAPSLRTQPRL